MLILRWFKAIIVLPGTVLIVIPSLILWSSKGVFVIASPSSWVFWSAIFLGALGSAIAFWTTSLFFRFGNGTAAPWDPPRRFVVRGPYRYVRNPMITAVMTILLAESLFFMSLPIFLWFIIFTIMNIIYIPTVEEKKLAKRFGDDYLIYKSSVPRWIPKLQPWPGEPHDAG